MPFPFEVAFHEVETNLDRFVDAVFGALESEFLVMPRGEGFVDFPTFDAAYERLKRVTSGFRAFRPVEVAEAVLDEPISLIVLRCMLGFTPPEWAYLATRYTGIEVPQGAARALDRGIRTDPERPLPRNGGVTEQRVRALVTVACEHLARGAPNVPADRLHRLDKADTTAGLDSLRTIASLGAPYSVLLYERFLGRPFAAHRDSVSEIVGNLVENAIEAALARADITFRKTGRAERIPGFDQAPDFIVPSELNPQVVIEAKLSEDDGTARDKITRVQHLSELSLRDRPADNPKFQVVACIAGRGFGIRREDMKKLIIAARGKVFTLQNMRQLVAHTRLREYSTLRRG